MKDITRLITVTWLLCFFTVATCLQAAHAFTDQVYILNSPSTINSGDASIVSISPTGEQTAFLGPDPQLNGSQAIAFNQAASVLYTLQYSNTLNLYQLVGYSPDAEIVDEITLSNDIGRSMSMDSSGLIYVSGTEDIYSIDTTTGTIELFATYPQSISAAALTHDSQNNLYVTDLVTQSVFKITPSGSVSNFASISYVYGITYDSDSDSIWITAIPPFDPARIYRYAVDGTGSLYAEVGDTIGYDVRTIEIYYDGLPLVPSPISDTIVKVDASGNMTDVWGPGLDSPTSIVFNPKSIPLTIDINSLDEPVTSPVSITGNATAVAGIASIQVAIRDQQTNLWWQDGSWGDWQLQPAELISGSAEYTTWRYQFDPSNTLASGEYRVFARVKDSVDQLSDAATLNFQVEDSTTVLPQTTIESPQANEVVSSPVSIHGSANADNGVARVSVGIRDQLTGKWWQQGSWGDWQLFPADVTSNNASATQVNWSTVFDPTDSGGTGHYRVFVTTLDTQGIKSLTTAVNFKMELSLESRLTYPGGDARVDFPLSVTGAGSAPAGVAEILVGIRDQSTGLWWNNGSWGEWILNPANEVNPVDNTGTRVTWRYEFDPSETLVAGTRQYRVFARTRDMNSLLSNSDSLNFYGTILPADGSLDMPWYNSSDFRQDGNTVVVATEYFGLYVVDTSDALNPFIVSNFLEEADVNGAALINDNTVAIFDRNVLTLYDITDENNPHLISQLFLGETDYKLKDLTLSSDKNRVYLVSGDWFTESGKLFIVDISNPGTPVLLNSVIINSDAEAVSVSLDNTLALVTGRGDFFNPNSFNGITLVDVSDPGSATITSTQSLDSEAPATLSSDGDTAYLSDYFGLQIIDVSDNTNPQILGNFYDEASAAGINEYRGSGKVVLSEDETTAYLFIDSLLRSVDVTDPTQPVITGTLEAAGRPVYGKDIELSPSKDKALIQGLGIDIQIIDFVWW